MSRIRLAPAFCARNGVAVLSDDGELARIGMLDASDSVLRLRMERSFPGARLAFEPIGADELSLTLARAFAAESAEGSACAQDSSGATEGDESAIDRLDEEAPLVNLLNSVFLEAIERKASDVHIESGREGALVRFRVDGRLETAMRVSNGRAKALHARLKILANVNALESRRPQDGRISLAVGGNRIDARLSTVPTVEGESAAIRLLNRRDGPLSLGDLGFRAEHLAFLSSVRDISAGLVVVTGPTGSGKTTTLSAMIRELNREGVKIVSLEDPVENRIEGVTQIQVNDEIGLTFDSILRRVFRQDPDVLTIGEIRDGQTAELAVRAALTGHLVFATLHTNSAMEAVVRLEDMGVAPYLVASTLRASIGQRLVRKRCAACGGSATRGNAECPTCRGTGYSGRTVIAEIVPVTKGLARKIRSGASADDLVGYLSRDGFVTMDADAGEKIRAGITTREEVRAELGASDERA
jgi:type II secretory ATPase GspE/PulE/Tfp pilus assembly ATPase PilB-like protein